ncbi:MAG: protein translocase subunit SecDF [Paludibacteraceae bacterium]|nr:protein translocase subunit SecDF [Paludibacteraceae bacterium]
MQNKGFVRFIAIALLLICLYYLSFTFVTRHYEQKAQEIAQGDQDLYYNYLDSMSGEEVFLGYTLKQCRERELNLGLDLKGGMNVTLEVSVSDILKSLSGDNQDPSFNQALQNAKSRQAYSGENFLKLFEEEYKKIEPNAPLAGIFATYDLKDKISASSTDAQVIEVLQAEIDAAIANSFNVLRSRIDRFGVVQPNIQALDVEGRILVELPGVKEPERVRKLLQGSANLEFWPTYKYSEIAPFLENADTKVKDILAASNGEEKVDTIAADSTEVAEEELVAENNVEEEVVEENAEEAAPAETTDSTDDIASKLVGEDGGAQGEAAQGNEQDIEKFKKEHPLLAILNPIQNQGPVVGYSLAQDTAKVNKYLAMKQVADIFPADARFRWTVKPIDPDAKQLVFQLIAIKLENPRVEKAPLEGEVITDARSDFDQYSASATVSMTMNSEGAKEWARLTKNNVGREVAIVLDNYVYSFPTVNQEITGGNSQITGHFTVEEAKDLANVLKSGKMPAPARIVQEDVVGPSLGETAIHNGLISFVIAFILVLLYMIMYYGLIPGLIADGALLINLVFIFGVLASFKAVLTLPGIAGFVFTMGTAVDANVLIYERIREELRAGKNFKKAVTEGYGNALSAIIDANVTTMITGVILFIFGSGPVKGFATTLMIGIVTSVFTAVFLTRLVYDRMNNKEKERNLPFTTNLTKNWFQNIHFDFIGKRKFGYTISLVAIVIAIASLCIRGMEQGIDFSGGRNYIVKFEKPVNIDEIRPVMETTFPESQVSVITMGSENQIRISTNYEVYSTDENIDGKIEDMLYNALKPVIGNEAVTKEMFVQRYIVKGDNVVEAPMNTNAETFGIQSSQKVGPTVADDIKVAAVWAIIIALIGIGLYILLRFRNWAFSVGAIAALAHDVLIILGIYSLFYSVAGFSMEVDQSFIAAILTVVGYSINDTVVIFDRIRENIGLYPKRDLHTQISESICSTLSRTFSTSLSTFIVLLAIFIFGGETIRGFVFAILLGVIVGTYSTIFIASPLSYSIQSWREKRKAAKAA